MHSWSLENSSKKSERRIIWFIQITYKSRLTQTKLHKKNDAIFSIYGKNGIMPWHFFLKVQEWFQNFEVAASKFRGQFSFDLNDLEKPKWELKKNVMGLSSFSHRC